MGRIVVFMDEIEKAFPTGNELDSGVSADMLSVWLTNLSDPSRQYYVIAAANNCKKLPDALLRPGRFDNIVMVDLPKPAQQKLIWDICIKRFGLPEQPIPPHDKWSGTEIDACCENADGYGITLIEAAKKIVPTAVLSPEAVTAVQDYAHNRAIDAETGEIYRKPGSYTDPVLSISTPVSSKSGRKIMTSNDSNN
jgi:SpoVK/Ycf46/Vps4 family AAA+-type ATPase